MKSRVRPRWFLFMALVAGIVLCVLLVRPAPRGHPGDRRNPIGRRDALPPPAPDSGGTPSLKSVVEPAHSDSISLTGEAANAALQKNGQYESLGVALSAARHAIEKIDPAGPHSRGAGYFAVNPRQQLRAWFSGDRVELASGSHQVADREPWSCGMRLSGVGRGKTVTAVSPGQLSGRDNRVEINHAPSSIIQWFENRTEGLEHGFTLGRSPAGKGGEFRLQLVVDGTLRVQKMTGEDGIRLVDHGGTAIVCYSALKAWDASGKNLAARMEENGDGSLALFVKDEGAIYPVTVDPLFVSLEDRFAEDATADAGDRFGDSLALYANTAVVGATHDGTQVAADAGSAYVFEGSPGGWWQRAKLSDSSGFSGAQFGAAVALSGRILKSNTTWQNAPVTATGPAYYRSIRFSITPGASNMNGIVGVAAGAANSYAGLACVIRMNTSGYFDAWNGITYQYYNQVPYVAGRHYEVIVYLHRDSRTYTVYINGIAIADSHALGAGVVDISALDTLVVKNESGSHVVADFSCDTAMVGAPGGFLGTAGKAFIYEREEGFWNEKARPAPSNGSGVDRFGEAVALSDGLALVGAPSVRSAYIFGRNGDVWSQKAILAGPLTSKYASFGRSVALSSEGALVGAPYEDTAAGEAAGAAYLFAPDGAVWSEKKKFVATGGRDNDYFGLSVALCGSSVVIGAPGGDTYRVWDPYIDQETGDDTGFAYVFSRNGGVWSQQAVLGAADPSYRRGLGYSVAAFADMILVGCRGLQGRAISYYRDGAAWAKVGEFSSATAAPYSFDQFGTTVALSGDCALVGDPGANTGTGDSAGSVYVYERNGPSMNLLGKLFTSDGPMDEHTGLSVALQGDTAIFGVPRDSTPAGANVGSAFVFKRVGVKWIQQSKVTASDGESYDYFGATLALSHDTAVIGAPYASDAGAAYVFLRNGTEWREQAKLTVPATSSDDGFGDAVAIDGNTIVVGASHADSADLTDSGATYVFIRTGTVWSKQAALTDVNGVEYAYFGESVAISGDTVVAGSPRADTAVTSRPGAAYVFVRNGLSWGPQTKVAAPDGQPYDNFGKSVALDGDTLLIGAPMEEFVSLGRTGAVYAYVRNASFWTQQAKLTSSANTVDEFFGGALALSGNLAVVCASLDNGGGGAASGSAFVYQRVGGVWNEQNRLSTGLDSSVGDNFGRSVALDGNLALVTAIHEQVLGAGVGAIYSFSFGELPEIAQQPLSKTIRNGVAVSFSISATGQGPLRYQWRKDGFQIAGATATSYEIPFAQMPDSGNYDCVVSNIGGVVTSAAATLNVNAFSQFTPVFPTSPPTGSLFVNLTPSGVGGWRFAGEQAWRAAGSVGGLPAGGRTIEFMPVGGYLQLATATKTITEGGAALVTAAYATGPAGIGSLKVVLDAGGLPAKWRIFKPGTNNDPWRNSGFTLTGLPVGISYVECKPVSGHITPPPVPVIVDDGPPSFLPITYPVRDAPVDIGPKVVPFETVTSSTDRPFAFVGQIRSDLGFSSGFVVKSRNNVMSGGTVSRVVATAGHVVFDDSTKSFVGGLQWLLQRDRDAHEPEALIPRGAHLMDDYAAARVGVSPGIGNETSQNRDAAALFFSKDAGGGGYGGLLASNDPNNEFLLTTPPNATTLKMLVGYPVEGDEFIQGRMYASPPTAASFSRVAPNDDTFRTFRTTGLSGAGGMSGGPLCVQFEGGVYLPAAIYLGGSGESIVRAIDGQVVDLIERAEASSATGDNQTGGGFTLLSFSNIAGGSSASGAVHVTIFPASARSGAYWRVNKRAYHQSDTEDTLPAADAPYTLYVAPLEGFVPPDPVGQPLAFKGGKIQEVTYTYVGAPEISIEQPANTPLADGASTSSLGSVVVKKSSPTKTFTIRNSGHADLTGLKITKNGANSTDFIVTQPLKTSLANGATTSFKVTFKPSATGNRKAAIHIASNDADESSFDITLTGKGVAASSAASGLAATIPRLPLVYPIDFNKLADGDSAWNRRETITTVTLADGRKYLALTVIRSPGVIYQKRDIEVSPNLIDWYSGVKHTTVMTDNASYLKVRDNTPFTAERKRFIRLKRDDN
ncbi:MAG: choice-of-anchor D domain-containing protein [Luteolibacter sp.]|uniref:choice-of-anchor D domain-containing protein n=1 Tax=Luteolibacter sp. TaxID=1962973 RepID=UPI003267D4DF